jgi:GT2 family glycosyltransferase
MSKKIRFVVSTRHTRENFFTKTATGRSLALYSSQGLELDLHDSNREGLSKVYNHSIEKSKKNPAILIFAHDDIHLLDFFWADQLLNALNHFDIVGIAGNKRRISNQPGWLFIDDNFTWDKPENLSGVIGHGTDFPPRILKVFGPPFQEVKLLDGLFLACHSETLQEKNLQFDEQFDFHFYDLDFCRQAEEKNAKMGTSKISLVHQSKGDFKSTEWQIAKNKYFAKWGE